MNAAGQPTARRQSRIPAGGKDAVGAEIWSFLHGGSPYEIVERSDGLITAAASVRYYFSTFKDWNRRQRLAMTFLKGPRVLDVGCGAGRVALYLQQRRIHVTAIDISPLAIRTCRYRGVKDARVLALDGIVRFPSRHFNTIVMYGHNFGLFGNRRKAWRLFRVMHRITSDDAVILTETLDPHDTDDPVHHQYLRRNRRLGRMPGQIRLRVRCGLVVGPWFDYLFVSPAEMRDVLHGTGWEISHTIRDRGPSYVAILRKPMAR